jgi:HK97 family phage portal protein
MSMVAAWSSRARPGMLSATGSLTPPVPGFTYGLPGPYVYDTTTARQVPAVGRAIQLYGGMAKQMRLDVYRGYQRVDPTPRLAQRPDPLNARSWFVQCSVEDYLLNGNAISLVTARGADGWPLAVMWLPASWVYIVWQPGDPTNVDYFYAPAIGLGFGITGVQLPSDQVIHVKRGADRGYPVRGIGVVEEFIDTLDRAAMEEEYERSTLNGAAVPSVAIIAPQAQVPQDVADQAKADWIAKYGGPTREPAVLPAGTQVVPLAWSPADTQLSEARKLTLTDVANLFNLDGYWLGAPTSGITYKTAAPQYQQILRTSLEPVISDFEDVWSYAWLPRGVEVRFDRTKLLRDDLATTAGAVSTLVAGHVITPAEGRVMLGLPPSVPDDLGLDATEELNPATSLGPPPAPSLAPPPEPDMAPGQPQPTGGTQP